MNYDRTAVTNTYLQMHRPLTRLEHPTVDVLWRPETAVYVISQQVKSIAGAQLGLISQ